MSRTYDIFRQCLTTPVDELDEKLAQLCAADTELMRDVRELLAAARALPADYLEESNPPSFPPSLRPGDEVDSYRIDELIESGGMGVVYRATELGDVTRIVAIKIYRPVMEASRINLVFKNEAQLLADMAPGAPFVSLLKHGLTSGHPYLVMPFVDGLRLDSHAQSHSRNENDIVSLMVSVSRALAVAHQNGVIHRDIKPSNILITRDNRPIVLDFGIAVRIRDSTAVAAVPQEIRSFGSYAYASPEHHSGALTTSSDVYSLGVILYELLSTICSSAKSTFKGLRKRELESILRKATSPRPDDRYPSAAALADDLERFLKQRTVQAHGGGPWYVGWAWSRRYSTALLIVAIVLGLFADGLLIWRAREGRSAMAARLAESAIAHVTDDPELSLLLAAAAGRMAPQDRAIDALQHALRSPLRAVLRSHAADIAGVAFSPDGTLVASIDEGGVAVLADRASGQEMARFEAQVGRVVSLEFQADGRLLAVHGEKFASVWNVSVSDPQLVFATERPSASFRRGFTKTLEGRSSTLVLHESRERRSQVKNRALLNTEKNGVVELIGHRAAITGANYSWEDRWVVTRSEDRTVRVWEVATGRAVTVLDGHAAPVLTAMFSPNDTMMVTGDSRGLTIVWDTRTWQPLKRFWTSRGAVVNADFSLDEQVLLTVTATGATLRNPLSGQAIASLSLPQRRFQFGEMSLDGHTVATITEDGSLQIWTRNWTQPELDLPGFTGRVNRIAIPDDSPYVSLANDDGTTRIVDRAKRSIVYRLSWPGPYTAGQISGDNEINLVKADNHRTHTHDELLIEGEAAAIFIRRSGSKSVVASFPNPARFSRYDACSVDVKHERALCEISQDTIRLWDAKNSRVIGDLKHGGESIRTSQFSPDGTTVVTMEWAGPGRVWNAETAVRICFLGPDRRLKGAVAFSPDSTLVATAAYDDGRVFVWDARSCELIHELRGHSLPVTAIAFSSKGDLLATGSRDRTVRLWEIVAPRLDVQSEGEYVADLRFLDSGRVLAMTTLNGGGRAWVTQENRLWDRPPSALWNINGSESKSAQFQRLSSRPNDFLMIDGFRLQMWSLQTGHRYFDIDIARDNTDPSTTPKPGQSNVSTIQPLQLEAIDVNSDATRLLAVLSDGTAHVWDTTTSREVSLGKVEPKALHAAGFLDDDTYVVAAEQLQLRDTISGRLQREISLGRSKIWAFEPTRRRAVAMRDDDDTALVFETRSGNVVTELPGLVGEKRMATFSPDGRLLVTVTSDSATTWDAQTGRRLSQLRDGRELLSVDVIGDGRFGVSQVYSAGAPQLMLWSTATGLPLLRLAGSAATLTPDRRFLAVGSHLGRVSVYETPELAGSFTELLGLADKRLTRQLSPAELSEYGGGKQTASK